MSELVSMIATQLGTGGISQIAKQLGANEQQAGTAIQAAIPMLVGALAKNAQQPEGAGALGQALDRDHDGSILDDLGGFLQQGNTASGQAILGHLLTGNRQQSAVQGLNKAAGLSGDQSGNLLAMLAPVVMGALGKQKQESGLDVGALAQMLGGQQSQMQSNPLMAAATALLDADGDGSVIDDLAEKAGGSLLGGLFGR